jgi:hypothetical protein
MNNESNLDYLLKRLNPFYYVFIQSLFPVLLYFYANWMSTDAGIGATYHMSIKKVSSLSCSRPICGINSNSTRKSIADFVDHTHLIVYLTHFVVNLSSY